MPAPEPARDADLKGAMECKVRVEALVAAARKSSERRQLGKALGYWSEQQRTIGARLGKDMGQMLADELIFGLTEASNPNWRRAVDCVRSAVVPPRLTPLPDMQKPPEIPAARMRLRGAARLR